MEKKKVCPLCGCCGGEDKDKKKEEKNKVVKKFSHDETHFAVLLALVPAMTLSLFNLMGLV